MRRLGFAPVLVASGLAAEHAERLDASRLAAPCGVTRIPARCRGLAEFLIPMGASIAGVSISQGARTIADIATIINEFSDSHEAEVTDAGLVLRELKTS